MRPLRPFRVLITEDDPDWHPHVRNEVEVGLSGLGLMPEILSLRYFDDGFSALQSAHWDLLVTDMRFKPGEINTDLGKRLAAEAAARGIPCIVVSAVLKSAEAHRLEQDFGATLVEKMKLAELSGVVRSVAAAGRISAGPVTPYSGPSRVGAGNGLLFLCYARSDAPWLSKVLTHLQGARLRFGMEAWSDRDLRPGDRWHERILQALERARVAVLLVTPSFLRSEYIQEQELPPLLRRAEQDETRLTWIAVEESMVHSRSEVSSLQCLNDPARPLASLKAEEEPAALVQTCTKIVRLCESWRPLHP